MKALLTAENLTVSQGTDSIHSPPADFKIRSKSDRGWTSQFSTLCQPLEVEVEVLIFFRFFFWIENLLKGKKANRIAQIVRKRFNFWEFSNPVGQIHSSVGYSKLRDNWDRRILCEILLSIYLDAVIFSRNKCKCGPQTWNMSLITEHCLPCT